METVPISLNIVQVQFILHVGMFMLIKPSATRAYKLQSL